LLGSACSFVTSSFAIADDPVVIENTANSAALHNVVRIRLPPIFIFSLSSETSLVGEIESNLRRQDMFEPCPRKVPARFPMPAFLTSDVESERFQSRRAAC
jgi:hypothetical protein